MAILHGMTQFRLAAAALNQTPLAWDENRQNILSAINAAREAEVGVLCLPELCISGYGCEDQFLATALHVTSQEILNEIVPQCRALAVSLGLVVPFEGKLFNAAAFVCDGQLLGFVAKQVLAGDGIHYEPRWFQTMAGRTCDEPGATLDGSTVSTWEIVLVRLSVELRIGFEICRRCVGARCDPAGTLGAARGADIIHEPQRQPLRVRQTGGPPQRASFVEGSQRRSGSPMHLRKPARKRVGSRDLRRRNADRQRWEDVGCWTAVLLRRFPTGHGRRRYFCYARNSLRSQTRSRFSRWRNGRRFAAASQAEHATRSNSAGKLGLFATQKRGRIRPSCAIGAVRLPA